MKADGTRPSVEPIKYAAIFNFAMERDQSIKVSNVHTTTYHYSKAK